MSDLARAQILHIKGLIYEERLLHDSASYVYTAAVDLLPADTLQAILLIRAACNDARVPDYDRYQTNMASAGKLVKKLNDPVQDAAFLGAKGDYYIEIEDYENAIESYMSADSILEAHGIIKGRQYFHNRTSYAYRRSSKYPPAFEHMLKSIEFSEQLQNKYRLVSSYLNISRMYRDVQRYDEAMNWEEKHLALAREVNSINNIRKGLENMGIIHAEKQEWDTAQSYFEQAMELAFEINNPDAITFALSNMGNFFFRKGDIDMALSYYEKSYEYRKKNFPRNNGMVNILFHLGSAHLAKKNYELSEKYLLEAQAFADSSQNKGWALSVGEQLNRLYKTTKDYKKYALSLQYYLDANEKWDSDKENTRFNKLTLQYEKKQKDATIALMAQKLKTRRQLLIFLGIILLLIIAIITIALVNKKAKEQAIKTLYRQSVLAHDQQKVIKTLLEKSTPEHQENPENKMLTSLLHLLDVEHIYQNSDLSLDSLAQELGTNTTYVSRLINSEFNCNFKTFINRYRINYSKVEIRENPDNLGMKNIGMKAGFKSQSSFYAAFKQEVGMTPLQFAKVSRMGNKEEEKGKKSA
ncbi:tetratricopeptide repeat protein [Thermophagus xiamenensis]|uniref:Tetratricopeptide repeat-containing protein n=1 Tax=Thermophagus xiamenensis TaxID=385682 RepID=A0A1I2AJ16_9BACT|nr:tetratricopeptide repeat protein [Thermophagus xiamenensis]SFE43779.1 Tetratricopeptide repeat-containing protein [Thermophagus xiamenensis]